MDELLLRLAGREISIVMAIEWLAGRHEVSMPTIRATQSQESWFGFPRRWVNVTSRLGRSFVPLDVSTIAGGVVVDSNVALSGSTAEQKRRAAEANAFRIIVWPFIEALQAEKIVASGLAKRGETSVLEVIPGRIWRESTWMIHVSGSVNWLPPGTDPQLIELGKLDPDQVPIWAWEDRWTAVKVKLGGRAAAIIPSKPERYPQANKGEIRIAVRKVISNQSDRSRPNLVEGPRLVRATLENGNITATDTQIKEIMKESEFLCQARPRGRKRNTPK